MSEMNKETMDNSSLSLNLTVGQLRVVVRQEIHKLGGRLIQDW